MLLYCIYKRLFHTMSFITHLNQQIRQRIEQLKQWPATTEQGVFIGTRVFTKNNSIVIARCTLTPYTSISREIDISNLDVWDLTHARDPSRLVGETELVCTEEYFNAFIAIMEASGFVRHIAPK